MSQNKTLNAEIAEVCREHRAELLTAKVAAPKPPRVGRTRRIKSNHEGHEGIKKAR
jgi:hypothetical protein